MPFDLSIGPDDVDGIIAAPIPGVSELVSELWSITMMYRRHAAQHSAKNFDNIASKAEPAAGITAAFFAALHKLGVFAQAEQENRRFNRLAKRRTKSSAYYANGLNGPRAVARRRRQIERGQLQVTA